MSFKIDGTEWEPQNASAHTQAIITKINEILQSENIRDKDGNIVQLKMNYGNALYLIALGDGDRAAESDRKLSQAINSFNVELCDDQQLQNLLPIAAISRNPGSYTTLRLAVTASEDGDAIIPAGTKAPYENINFVVQNEVLLTAGTTQIINTVCDTIGPVAVLSGEVTSFDTEIPNLEKVENEESSIPGVAPETTNELRQRIIDGDTIKYSLNGCKNALETLTGVTYARVYFNYNTSTTITLPGGVVLQPRTAYIVIHGNSGEIASTYAEFMSAPTQNSPIGEGTYSTVTIKVKAASGGSVTLPDTTSVTYESHEFVISEETTIAAGDDADVEFVCTEWGPYNIPAYAITALDQTITNVESAYNEDPAIPGTSDPKHTQNWVTDSGQSVEIKYDTATEKNVIVKIWLKQNAEQGAEVENQLKRDLIVSSSKWGIGQEVTQLLTCQPFININYTEVAYTQVSLDGTTWSQIIELGCNEIPRVSDATIQVAVVGE